MEFLWEAVSLLFLLTQLFPRKTLYRTSIPQGIVMRPASPGVTVLCASFYLENRISSTRGGIDTQCEEETFIRPPEIVVPSAINSTSTNAAPTEMCPLARP